MKTARSAMTVKRTRGERISRHAPFGWDFTADARLVENGKEQEVIGQMHSFRADGLSYWEIAVTLDERAIAPKRGSKWAYTTVRSILERNAA